jgi:3-oxoacyl-[acyl-carrier-protein] synthase-3
MQGNQVFRHAVEKLASTANTALDKAGLGAGDVDWIVPHQANIRIIQGTAKKMGLSMDNVVVTVQDHGNTSAASIPLALSVGKQRGQIKEGDLIVTEAIGGGLAWGAVVVRWYPFHPNPCPNTPLQFIDIDREFPRALCFGKQRGLVWAKKH